MAPAKITELNSANSTLSIPTGSFFVLFHLLNSRPSTGRLVLNHFSRPRLPRKPLGHKKAEVEAMMPGLKDHFEAHLRNQFYKSGPF